MNNDRFKIRVWDKAFNRYWTDKEIKENAAWLLFPDNDNIHNIDIEQCTGLKDKTGKLIFEGYIIKIGRIHAPVIWNDGWFLKFGDFLEPFCHFKLFNCAIVGNIHENPELMK